MGNTNSTVYHCASCPKEFDSREQCDQHFRDAHMCVPTAGDINRMARDFHDAYARPLKKPQMDPNFRTFHKISICLFDNMFKQDLATQRICVGSVYERTNIQQSYDFDVLYVKREPNLTAFRDEKDFGLSNLSSEYVMLKNVGWFSSRPFPPREYMNKMKGSIQKILNNEDFDSGDNIVTLHDHGPAFRLEVRDRNPYSTSRISIDVVPTIEADGKQYVAKNEYWRVSHSYEAREKMLEIDDGSKCHREVYRTCKVIRNKMNLYHMTSYQLKSALFHTSDKWFKSWGRQYIGDRILDVMEYLRSAYASGSLPDYFDHGTNLLEGTNKDTRTNTANRLGFLKKNPRKMFE